MREVADDEKGSAGKKENFITLIIDRERRADFHCPT